MNSNATGSYTVASGSSSTTWTWFDDGSAGVREPCRPLQPTDEGGVVIPLPVRGN